MSTTKTNDHPTYPFREEPRGSYRQGGTFDESIPKKVIHIKLITKYDYR